MANPNKPNFLKDAAELAIERNSYPGNPGSGEITRQISEGTYPGQDLDLLQGALAAEAVEQIRRSNDTEYPDTGSAATATYAG